MPKVIVVEDDTRISTLVRHILEADGYVAVTCGEAEEAWRLLVAEVPDAGVIDLRLPGADGWSLIERIRDDGRFHRLPVVVLTGMHDQEVIAKATTFRAEYLGKPFSGEALLNKLRHAMEEAGKEPLEPAKQRVELRSQVVVILLGEYRVEGTVHLPSELERFSDAWESVVRDPRIFVPVTDAKIEKHDTGKIVGEAQLIQVHKVEIRAVYPAG